MNPLNSAVVRLACLALSAVAVLAPQAQAQGAPTLAEIQDAEAREKQGEELRGHRFLIPQLQDSAFVVTSFTSRLGAGLERADNVPFGALRSRSLRLGGLQQQFDLSVRLGRKFGLFLEAAGGVETGLNGTSLVLRTGEFTGEIRGGGVLRLWRSDDSGSQLAARLSGGTSTGRRFGMLSLLMSVDEEPVAALLDGDLLELLLVPTSEQSGRLSLHFAQTLAPTLSLQATVGGDVIRRTERPYDAEQNERVESSENMMRGDAAVALALDGAPANIPVALLAEYRLRLGGQEAQLTEAAEHVLGASVYYSGRDDLQLGLEGSYRLAGPSLVGFDSVGVPADSDPVDRVTGAVVFHYTW